MTGFSSNRVRCVPSSRIKRRHHGPSPEFQRDYPDWAPTSTIEETLREIHDANVERWAGSPAG